jgi:hypothetical protein
MPWPSIKATMSSFSDTRFSVLIVVKLLFSQTGEGQGAEIVESWEEQGLGNRD